MKKSDEFERLEEVRKEVTEELTKWVSSRGFDEELREVSVIIKGNSIYDFIFMLYMNITDVIFYRCIYFADLEELLVYEYSKNENEYSSVYESE